MFGKVFARCASSRQPRCLSRRRFLQAAAGSAGAMAAGFLWPTPTSAAGRDPKPLLGSVPNATGGPVLHINFIGPADAPAPNGNDPSSITDFDGFIGSADVRGTGTGTNTDTGDTFPLLFAADIRFMKGIYQRLDRRFAEATFAFV